MSRVATRIQPLVRDNVAMSDWTELLERFRRGPEILAAALTGAAGAEVDWAPAGKWNVRQIAAHMADSEIMISARMRSIIAENNPTLPAYDQDAWAANLGYEKRRPSESLELFRRLRAANFSLLSDVPEATLARTGTHTERGVLTLRALTELAAEHAENHARQIRELRREFKAASVRGAGGAA